MRNANALVQLSAGGNWRRRLCIGCNNPRADRWSWRSLPDSLKRGSNSACVVAAGIENAHMGVALVAIMVATFTMRIVGPGAFAWFNEMIQAENRTKCSAIWQSGVYQFFRRR